MPANNGRKPPHEFVDIKLRQGCVIRNTPSANWRFKPWPEGKSGGDVISWQIAGALEKWEGRRSSPSSDKRTLQDGTD